MIAEGSFEDSWPELQQRLKRALARRGVAPWLADDVIQETGLRLFRCWANVDPERSPFGLALRIAHNILWDETRKRAAREVLGEVPDTPEKHDVEELGLARLELKRARRFLDELSPVHRSVLLAEVGGKPVPEKGAAATKMIRMRARRRLSALMGSASTFGFIGIAFRDLQARAYDLVRRHGSLSEPTTATAVAAAGIFTAVAVIGLPNAPRLFEQPSENAPRPAIERTLQATRLTNARQAIDVAPRTATQKPTTKRPGRAATASEPARPDASSYDVSLGDDDGPAQGGATVTFVPDEDENWAPSAPSCEHQLDPEHGEAGAFCDVDGPGDDVRAGAGVRLRP